jgi:tetratricopeptide (TPR) repeat protein
MEVVLARVFASLLAAGVLLAAVRTAPAASRAERVAEADSLHRHALARLATPTLDARRLALVELERASLLDPERAQIWLDLGRLCLETGYRRRGRSCYQRAGEVSPDRPEAFVELGRAWTWEWLSSFESAPLARARESMVRATALASARADAWAHLAALELAGGRVDRATAAARNGLAAQPDAWEPLVALGCAAFRAGAPERADSAFRAARARLPEDLAWRFDDLVWTRDAHDGAPGGPPARPLAVAAVWQANDPDLTSPENEAELDYLTRLALALLLFRDANGVRWDMRTELFVRYGPPGTVEINPLGSPLAYQHNRYDTRKPPGYEDYRPPPIPYPYNVQAWSYPDLGIRVELWDRSLTQSFQLPVALGADADPRPDPALLAARPDLVALGRGRGVYRAMPPGAHPITARGHIARFPTDSGAVLVAHLGTDGEPGDTLRGAWAVVAADGSVRARGARLLGTSSCDPTGQRVADFTVAVPPGAYRVDLSVSGAEGRRGLVRLGATVPENPPGLALSDVVLLCGTEAAIVTPDVVRLEPDLERRVSGSRPVSLYFEMDRLTRGADGLARFAYSYSVQRADPDRDARKPAAAVYQASSEDTYAGTRRRQFVSVPTGSIRPGLYDLRIEVRDLVAGSVASAAARFVRE